MLITVLLRFINLYELLIFAYVLMSWFQPRGFLYDVYRALGTICEPWLGIFRRIVPSVGMLDISPMVAIIALELISQVLWRLLS